jgi:3-oxoacyl-[acyl-carrier-protein] synthase II
MDIFTQLAMAAACIAIEDAGINFENVNKDRVGVVVGSGIGGM